MPKLPEKQPLAGTTKRKSGTQTLPKANPPEIDINVVMEDVKNYKRTAMMHLEQSGNLKTTIKEAVINSINGLYEAAVQINNSRLSIQNNLEIILARRKTELDDNAQNKIHSVMEKIITQNLTQININTTLGESVLSLNERLKDKNTMELKLLEELEKLQEFRKEVKEDIEQIKQEQINTNTRNHTQPQMTIENPPPKTYAEIVTETPKTTHCLLISTDDPIDTSEDVANKIKKTIKAKQTGLQISKFRKVKDQKILIGTENKNHLDTIKTTLQNNKFKVEEKANKDPLVIIRNLMNSNTDDDILEAIKTQNHEIIQHIPEEEYRIQVRHRRKARNPMETHVVLQVSPLLWKALTTAAKIYVDIQRVPIFDLSPLVQCSRCLAFGHGKKWCTEAIDLCSHCSGPHMRSECPGLQAGEEPTCKNCLQAKCAKTDHNSFDLHCPVRKKWDALARSSVAYC